MMPDPWFEVVGAEIPLTQGDIITDCPLLTWETNAIPPGAAIDASLLRQAVKAFRADVVVMTQACDLEHEKVRDVILCPHVSLDEYRAAFDQAMVAANQNPTAKAWKRQCDDIRDGFLWNLAMLNAERTVSRRHRTGSSISTKSFHFPALFWSGSWPNVGCLDSVYCRRIGSTCPKRSRGFYAGRVADAGCAGVVMRGESRCLTLTINLNPELNPACAARPPEAAWSLMCTSCRHWSSAWAKARRTRLGCPTRSPNCCSK
jgi:hypothetical protein